MLRILLSRFRKHLVLHLLVPLAIGILVETAYVTIFDIDELRIIEGNASRSALIMSYLFSFRTLALVAGVFVSYAVVMLILIKKELVIRVDNSDLARLQDALNNAKSYFALSLIPLEEWFDPAVQVYLAKLLNRKLTASNFEHQRTLLFFSTVEADNAKRQLMDEYFHARCLAHMHKDCGIPLSYLQRKEIFKILDGMSPDDREALGCYPRWTKRRPFHFYRKLPLRFARRLVQGLDFALVIKQDGSMSVLRVSKHGPEVRIAHELRGPRVDPYKRLVEAIKATIYLDGGSDLDAGHDFLRIYYG